MAERDHYQTLGVPRGATQQGIKKAFRERAKECHPDRAGAEATSDFKAVAGAYEVLSDPSARARYDCQLRGGSGRRRPPAPVPWPGAARWVDDARAPRRPKADLILEVTPAEAHRGLQLPISLRAPRACPLCGGLGRLWVGQCRLCRGTGHVLVPRSLELVVPPGVVDGSLLSFESPKVAGLRLTVLVVVR